MSMLTTAVIGCGPAGIVMAAKLRQKGTMVTCFELAAEPGGIWNGNGLDTFTSRGLVAPIFSSMQCVLPKDFMSYSDIGMEYTAPQYPHHTFVRNYLHRYGEAKGIKAVTRFNTKVESCRYDETLRKWKLITVSIVTGDVHEWTFDSVAVCTGQHHQPRYPAEAKSALSEFIAEGGDVIHSAHLKNFRAFHNKHVVVVGDGVSAYDCMKELRRSGARVTHSSLLQLDDDAILERRGVGGGLGALKGASSSSGRRDVAEWLPRVLKALPFLRNREHHAHEIILKWLRFKNTDLLKTPRVGAIVRCSGKRLVCCSDPTMVLSQEDRIEEAKERSAAKHHVKPASSTASLNAEEASANSSSSGQLTTDSEGEVMLEDVDAVVFATGYELKFPFMPEDIRQRVEGQAQQMIEHQHDAKANNMEASADGEAHDTTTKSSSECSKKEKENDEGADPCRKRNNTNALFKEAWNRRGLYLGTLYTANPSLAFVGTQRDLLPPFMLFEAQAAFVANALTGRVAIPANEQGMMSHEDDLSAARPELRSIYSDRGVGLHSATYFNVLQEELGTVEGKTTYSSNLWRRKWRMVISGVLMAVHKFRSMAPLKRKKQHILFSNKI